MSRVLLIIGLLVLAGMAVRWGVQPEILWVGPQEGFDWGYYLYIPRRLSQTSQKKVPLLVIPNNTGVDDDHQVHLQGARRKIDQYMEEAKALGVPLLIPTFPRPRTHWQMYTHALDRNTLVSELDGFRRIDLQLLAMVDDAQERLAQRGILPEERVMLMGFSAEGMFVNRFTVLHPEKVLAAVVGSPGGWAIAPLTVWEGEELRYPVGVADLNALVGRPVDLDVLSRVPHFFYLGEEDENDSVPYTDGSDPQDREVVFRLFGETPLQRWEVTRQMYQQMGSAEFRTYPGVGHTRTPEIREDVRGFLWREVGLSW